MVSRKIIMKNSVRTACSWDTISCELWTKTHITQRSIKKIQSCSNLSTSTTYKKLTRWKGYKKTIESNLAAWVCHCVPEVWVLEKLEKVQAVRIPVIILKVKISSHFWSISLLVHMVVKITQQIGDHWVLGMTPSSLAQVII